MKKNRWIVITLSALALAAILGYGFRAQLFTRDFRIRYLGDQSVSTTYTRVLAGEAPRPNFLIIISDDQRYDSMDVMPRTRDLIFNQGLEFTSAYVTTPRCCPSRASILTGMYAHNHKVYTNDGELHEPTFVQYLHDAGYTTGIIGKYLNSYPKKLRHPPLPEFDSWAVFPSRPLNALYYDLPINIDGTVTVLEGYQVYTLRDLALEFIRDASQEDKPFLLMFTPYAPHEPAMPAPGDEKLFADLPPYRPPSFYADRSNKPEWMAALEPIPQDKVDLMDERRLDSLRSLHALDQAVEALIDELEAQGELDNTVIIYMSDNGVFLGEFQLRGKIFVYEPATHVPFGIRYPAMIKEPAVMDSLVANIDIAPTLYHLAGIPTPAGIDGQSLLPLFGGQQGLPWRDHLLLEGWPVSGKMSEFGTQPFFQAIHTGRYVYVESDGDRSELYDLKDDPFQLVNLIDNPDYADILAELKALLREERKSIPRVQRNQLTDESGD